MMHMLLRLLGTAGACMLAAYLVPGFVVANLYTALIVAVLLGIIGITIKPILSILTLPITIITFGLSSLVVNAGILYFLASFVEGFSVQGFIPALIGGLIISAVQWLLHRFI